MGMKTKIEFSEIKPGDLIEVVEESDGVKSVHTGIAHEHEGDWMSGYGAWYTEENGVLVINDARQEIYRVDVKPVKFEDIKEGDVVRVSFPPRGGMSENWDITHSREAMVYALYDEKDWLTPTGDLLVSKYHVIDGAKIEILVSGE